VIGKALTCPWSDARIQLYDRNALRCSCSLGSLFNTLSGITTCDRNHASFIELAREERRSRLFVSGTMRHRGQMLRTCGLADSQRMARSNKLKQHPCSAMGKRGVIVPTACHHRCTIFSIPSIGTSCEAFQNGVWWGSRCQGLKDPGTN
jgi:hypothetical protein